MQTDFNHSSWLAPGLDEHFVVVLTSLVAKKTHQAAVTKCLTVSAHC